LWFVNWFGLWVGVVVFVGLGYVFFYVFMVVVLGLGGGGGCLKKVAALHSQLEKKGGGVNRGVHRRAGGKKGARPLQNQLRRGNASRPAKSRYQKSRGGGLIQRSRKKRAPNHAFSGGKVSVGRNPSGSELR